MAGGFINNKNPKGNQANKNGFNNEVVNDYSIPQNPIDFILEGVLNPGESVNFDKSEKKPNNANFNFLTKSINQEQALFVNSHAEEIKKSIDELRLEIKKLIQSTDNIDIEIEQVAFQEVIEINEYQLNFLQRIKSIIISFRQNIDQAGVWFESLNHKKGKKNAFWNKAKSKNGGEQYLMSSEHSASRSAN